MASFVGKFEHYKNENIEEYFEAIGVPYIGRKMMAMTSPLMEITFDGEKMTIKISTLMRTVEHKFKLGEEYEEEIPNITIKSTTTIINDNEIITHSVIPQSGKKSDRHYLFTDDECIVTLTHEDIEVPGKRYFRRLKK